MTRKLGFADSAPTLTFIDLFAGCGGFSLGLRQAGLRGLFAIERHPDAFRTFEKNLLEGPLDLRFAWPTWLPKRAWSIEKLIAAHREDLLALRGKVHVVAGGPPCQGFSYSGKRKKLDSRNMLFKRYVEFVDLVRPEALLLENVPGMGVPHGALKRQGRRSRGRKPLSYLQQLIKALSEVGYKAKATLLNAEEFGVPQRRPRIVVVGIREGVPSGVSNRFSELEKLISLGRNAHLESLSLPARISAKQAISDLETLGRALDPCLDPESPRRFEVPRYVAPRSAYQKLMHKRLGSRAMDSTRLARHSKVVKDRFLSIIKHCRQGVRLNEADRAKFGTLKHRVFPMAASSPAPTITTLPDDVLHYSEPRILSVRECARIQSFPDWFEFRGKYTTGGDRRRKDCPRYTQVGNAVPPLFARALGLVLRQLLRSPSAAADQAKRRKSMERIAA